MKVEPTWRARRGSDAAAQREAQEALIAIRDAWRADARCVDVLAELAGFGRGEGLSNCVALQEIFGRRDLALEFTSSLLGHFLPELATRPLGMVPFRHVTRQDVSSLLVARSGRAMLMLSACEPGAFEHASVGFSDGERHKIVLAGKGRAKLVTLSGAKAGDAHFEMEAVALQPGKCLAFEQAREALLVENVERRLVMLRLIRTPELPQPSREFALADGTLHHRASGELAESRFEMMCAVLGRMGRRDAAPVMAEMARAEESRESSHLRWQALRECLALDSETGFRTLCEIARDAADPLAAPAGALRAQLVEAHPELAALEEA